MKRYISDSKINEKFNRYIYKNIPTYHHLETEDFKVGPEESTGQNCYIQISNPNHSTSNNQFVHISWLALLFEENIKLKGQLQEGVI